MPVWFEVVFTGLCVALFAIVTFVYVYLKRREKFYHNRVWCVCPIHDRFGLIPRSVYDCESRRYWRVVRRIIGKTSRRFAPILLNNLPDAEMIVVRKAEFDRLMEEPHFLEYREFWVPTKFTSFAKAYEMMNGHPPKQ